MSEAIYWVRFLISRRPTHMSSVCDADLRQGCTMLTLLPYICQNNLRNIVHQIFLRFVGEYFGVFLDERYNAQLAKGYQLQKCRS